MSLFGAGSSTPSKELLAMRLVVAVILAALASHGETKPTTLRPSGIDKARPGAGSSAPARIVAFDTRELTKAVRRKVLRTRPPKRTKAPVAPMGYEAFKGLPYQPGKPFARIDTEQVRHKMISASFFEPRKAGVHGTAFRAGPDSYLRVTLKDGPGMYVLSCTIAYPASESRTFEVTTPDETKHAVELAALDRLHMTVNAEKDWWYPFEIRADGEWDWWDCEAAPLVGKGQIPPTQP
jgi:hypothetical protein